MVFGLRRFPRQPRPQGTLITKSRLKKIPGFIRGFFVLWLRSGKDVSFLKAAAGSAAGLASWPGNFLFSAVYFLNRCGFLPD